MESFGDGNITAAASMALGPMSFREAGQGLATTPLFAHQGKVTQHTTARLLSCHQDNPSISPPDRSRIPLQAGPV